MDDEKLITSGEAARMFGWTRRSLSRWAAEGRLKPAKRSPGGRLYWSPSDLRRQLEALERGHEAGE